MVATASKSIRNKYHAREEDSEITREAAEVPSAHAMLGIVSMRTWRVVGRHSTPISSTCRAVIMVREVYSVLGSLIMRLALVPRLSET